jgi:hypothetical protein
LQKILMRLRGMNFCTSSACFAPSFVRLPNSPKCTQIVRNAPKYHFAVQYGGSGALVMKNPTRLRGTNFSTCSARFAPSFLMQPNCLKCTQIVRNAPKYHFAVQYGGSGALVVKNPTRLRGTNFSTCSARFAPSFLMQPNCLKCTQIV